MSVAGLLLTMQAGAIPPAPPRSIPPAAIAIPAEKGWNTDAASLATAARGLLLYAYDQAAWHGTDDLFGHHRDAVPKRGGYIVDGPTDEPRIVFFDAASRRATYRARLVGGRIVDAHLPTGAELDLTPAEQRLIAAREAASAAVLADPAARPCAAKPFNTIVIPPETPADAISVYLMTPQTTNDIVPLGGHFRVDVDAAGKAGPVQRFTRACLPTPARPATDPKLGKPVGLSVSQLIGDRPTEIHVFTSLTVRQPIYVVTGAAQAPMMWIVQGAHIAGPRPLPAQMVGATK